MNMKQYINSAIASRYFQFFVTVILFIVLYGIGIAMYNGFSRPQVFWNLLIDNASLIIVTVGVTFTIITGGGGIDISVGAVVALVCMCLAYLLQIDPRHEGEALWPERHSLARLLSAKQSNPHVFMSLYQQDPRPAEGLLFPAEALNYFEMEDIRGRTPDGVIAVADVADTGEDYYCMIVAYLFGNDIYVVDVIYTQDQAEITEPLTLGALDNWKVQRFRIESNAGGRLYAKSIREKAKGFTAIEAVPSSTNKETRILTASGQIKQRVHFRQDYAHGSDYEKFYDHFTSYTIRGPNEHDDAPARVTCSSPRGGAICSRGASRAIKEETNERPNRERGEPRCPCLTGGGSFPATNSAAPREMP